MHKAQRGVIPLIIPIILVALAGLGAAVYLAQHRTNILPKAEDKSTSENRPIEDQSLPTQTPVIQPKTFIQTPSTASTPTKTVSPSITPLPTSFRRILTQASSPTPTSAPTSTLMPSPTPQRTTSNDTTFTPSPTPSCTLGQLDCAGPPANCHWEGGNSCSCGTMVCSFPTTTPNTIPQGAYRVSFDSNFNTLIDTGDGGIFGDSNEKTIPITLPSDPGQKYVYIQFFEGSSWGPNPPIVASVKLLSSLTSTQSDQGSTTQANSTSFPTPSSDAPVLNPLTATCNGGGIADVLFSWEYNHTLDTIHDSNMRAPGSTFSFVFLQEPADVLGGDLRGYNSTKGLGTERQATFQLKNGTYTFAVAAIVPPSTRPVRSNFQTIIINCPGVSTPDRVTDRGNFRSAAGCMSDCTNNPQGSDCTALWDRYTYIGTDPYKDQAASCGSALPVISTCIVNTCNSACTAKGLNSMETTTTLHPVQCS